MGKGERGLAMEMQRGQDGQAAARRSRHSAAPGGITGKARSAGGRLLALLRRGDEGQAMVEAALVISIILIPLMMGTFSIVVGTIKYEQLGEATFAGSQIFQNGRGMLGTFTPPNDPCADAAAAVATALPSWDPTKFTYTVQIWTNWTSSASTAAYSATFSGTAAATCVSAYNQLSQYQPATLTVSYQYSWIPGSRLNLGTTPLTQQKTVLVE